MIKTPATEQTTESAIVRPVRVCGVTTPVSLEVSVCLVVVVLVSVVVAVDGVEVAELVVVSSGT